MRLGTKEVYGRSRHKWIEVVFVGFLVLLSVPSLYYSALATSHHSEIVDFLHLLSSNTSTTANSTVEVRYNDTFASTEEILSTLATTRSAFAAILAPPKKQNPLVAVVVCTRSKASWRHVNQTSLHTLLIPSIERTVTVHDLRRYRLEFVLGFDKGDTFWEKETNRQELSDESLFPISFVSIPKNPKRPHQIPFNQLCRSAYEYGADYIVRVNDDTEFMTPDWISKSVHRLSQFNPPNLGVVGPTCKQGNTQVGKSGSYPQFSFRMFGTMCTNKTTVGYCIAYWCARERLVNPCHSQGGARLWA